MSLLRLNFLRKNSSKVLHVAIIRVKRRMSFDPCYEICGDVEIVEHMLFY